MKLYICTCTKSQKTIELVINMQQVFFCFELNSVLKTGFVD